ncbi:PA2778 family cysteine peptidase [Thioalkalivibrio sulfidiphilus]|uniref:TPR repeat-containing protein n=1 Tax=Thioalkalivibrio sulfidiphilus (strain HL-EbGR7) TaxID=396588 RepID=B8GUN2_THISH|nr:PA2778 family cysteine peptidase [Thioalkalivibrio sulfidiphilus]ACL71393.1 TPR repeat-containing protein [Thioalkalivibrio sulfidiphilus HL-EbGr7]
MPRSARDARQVAGVFFSLLLVALLGAGCATAPQSKQLARGAPPDLPEQVELTHVPFFPQEDYQCGPAALATVLVDLGVDTHPDALVSEVYIPERQGSLQTEMLAAARARGLVAYPLNPRLEDVLREVAAGHPVLVFQNLGVNFAPYWHYAVVIGYDLPAREIVLRSGTIERHVNSFSRFERTWRRGERWAFITLPPDQVPATGEALPWLRAANNLEQIGRTEAAAVAYETATRQWPEQPISWIALGNLRYAQGELAASESAFRALIEHQPEAHAGWNNLAHVLKAQGCGEQARQAARCAVALAPDNAQYRQTLVTMDGAEVTRTCAPLHCPLPTQALAP